MGDFGLATKVDYDGERKRTLCGTPNYIAPEVLTKKGTFTCRKLKIEYKSLICGKGNHCNLSILIFHIRPQLWGRYLVDWMYHVYAAGWKATFWNSNVKGSYWYMIVNQC